MGPLNEPLATVFAPERGCHGPWASTMTSSSLQLLGVVAEIGGGCHENHGSMATIPLGAHCWVGPRPMAPPPLGGGGLASRESWENTTSQSLVVF